MTIKPIRKTDIDTVAWLAAECFADDNSTTACIPTGNKGKSY